jgi:hypothetical protein
MPEGPPPVAETSPPSLLPFEPGQSPFHVRGNIYAGTRKFFDAHVPGGIEAAYREIRDPKLLAFFQQEFKLDGWYDVLPVAALIRAEARAMGVSMSEYLRARARFQAQLDINGLHRLLLKIASPEMVAMRLPALISRLFDFGHAGAERRGRGHVSSFMRGWPLILVEWYLNAFNVYTDTALRLAGAIQCTVRLTPAEPDGAQHDIPTVTIRSDTLWR